MELSFARGTRLGALVRRQHGLVTRRQLREAGATARQIEHRLRGGQLLPTRHRAVYAVGHYQRTDSARHLAAVLAFGPDAVVSHLSAAAQWRLCGRPDTTHVTSPASESFSRSGVRLHAATLADAEKTKVDNVPVTTVARLLLDVAALDGRGELERVYAAADRSGLIRHADIRELTERSRGRRGVALLRDLHALRDPEDRPAKSELERIAFELFAGAGIPPSRTNVFVAGREVDMIWDEQGVMVELDGYRYHAGNASFEADRDRDLEMSSRGYRVVRVTWAMIRDRPDAVVSRLRRTLAR